MTRTGLTLVEVLIALIVIAVAFMALASVQISNLSTTRGSQQTSTAMQDANDFLEEKTLEVFKKTGPDHAISEYYNCPDTTAVPCSFSDTKGDFTRMVTFTGLYQKPTGSETRTPEQYRNEGLIKADVSVTGPAEVSFTSYISCYDVAQTTNLETGDLCPPPYAP